MADFSRSIAYTANHIFSFKVKLKGGIKEESKLECNTVIYPAKLCCQLGGMGEGERGEYSHLSEMIVLDRSVLDKAQLSNHFRYIENSEQSVKQLSHRDYSL